MPTKNEILAVRALMRRKTRGVERKFVAEGRKVVEEALASGWPVHGLYATAGAEVPAHWGAEQVAAREMERMSSLQTPPGVLAVLGIPEMVIPQPADLAEPGTPKLVLALDGIADPGNLGTIIRTADWFGMSGIFLGGGAVDHFNPKVVQATMGALFRVPVWTLDLRMALGQAVSNNIPVCGLDLEGRSVWDAATPPLPDLRILVVGSESHGISEGVKSMCTEFLHIPGAGRSESLNASMAAGIAMAAWDAERRSS